MRPHVVHQWRCGQGSHALLSAYSGFCFYYTFSNLLCSRGHLICIFQWLRCQVVGLVQERRNSTASAMELRLSCTKPSRYKCLWHVHNRQISFVLVWGRKWPCIVKLRRTTAVLWIALSCDISSVILNNGVFWSSTDWSSSQLLIE